MRGCATQSLGTWVAAIISSATLEDPLTDLRHPSAKFQNLIFRGASASAIEWYAGPAHRHPFTHYG